MNAFFIDLMWRLLASPVTCALWSLRMIRRWRFWKIAYAPEIMCGNCGTAISLVGIWRCGCQFTYRGHLMRECPVCGSMPRMVRCFNCGVTEVLPECD